MNKLAMINSCKIMMEKQKYFFCQKSLWNSGAHYTCMCIILNKIQYILALLQKFQAVNISYHQTFHGHLFQIRNASHSAFALIKNSLDFNFLYLIKHFNRAKTLCINTFACLKINQHSTGLFVSYSVKNPIAWKHRLILPIFFSQVYFLQLKHKHSWTDYRLSTLLNSTRQSADA